MMAIFYSDLCPEREWSLEMILCVCVSVHVVCVTDSV